MPTPEEILEASAEALESAHTQVRHGDKAITYKSVSEIRASLQLADELQNGQQRRVVARPRRPNL